MIKNNVYPFPSVKRAEGNGKPPGVLAGSVVPDNGALLELPAAGLQMLIEHYSNATKIALTHSQLEDLRQKRKLIAHKDGETAELCCLPLGLLIHVKQLQLVQAGELVTRYRIVVYNGTLIKPTRHALTGPSDAAVFHLLKEVLASTYNTLTCLGLTDHLQPEHITLTEGVSQNVFLRMLD